MLQVGNPLSYAHCFLPMTCCLNRSPSSSRVFWQRVYDSSAAKQVPRILMAVTAILAIIYYRTMSENTVKILAMVQLGCSVVFVLDLLLKWYIEGKRFWTKLRIIDAVAVGVAVILFTLAAAGVKPPSLSLLGALFIFCRIFWLR